MKIILCLVILLISFYIGKRFLSATKDECDSVAESLKLLDYLKININFSHKKKQELLSEFFENKKTILKEVVIGNSECEKPWQKQMKQLITEFGATDLDGQNLLLERYRQELILVSEDLKKRYASQSGYVVKLSICLGLALCILII